MKLSIQSVVALLLLVCSIFEAQASDEWIYSVRPGDSLIDIANSYLSEQENWRKLQKLNQISNPRRLVPGSKLRIPVKFLKQEAAVAEIIRIQGDDVHKIVKDTALPLSAGEKLVTGDVIKTGANSNLTLRFVDGSRLLVSQNSQLKLTRMMVYGKTGMAQTVVNLLKGGIDTQVSRQAAPAAKYEIESQALNLGVRGTDFRARVDDNGRTRGEVIDGRVMAAGKGGVVGLNAGFGTLASQGEAPAAPIKLLAPPRLEGLPNRLEHVPLRFKWPALPGAIEYHAQVFADRSFEQLLLDGTFQEPSAKWKDLPDGNYVLRIRGIDKNGLEGMNADHDFVLKARPEAPFISGPLDGGKSYGPQAVFQWAKAGDIQRYHLQLSQTADFSSMLFDAPDINKTEHALELSPGQYYWRIASVRADGDQGPFSDVQGFTQRKIPQSPFADSPQMNDKQLSFGWKAEEAGQKFQVQFARDKEFKDLVSDTEVSEPRLSMTRPEGGTYFIRIKAIDNDGFAGPFGQAQQIEVPNPAPAWMLFMLIPILLGL